MIINILLPFKEKFSKNKASSVSITVSNNIEFSKFKNKIRVFGQDVEDPIFDKNFVGIKRKWNFISSKNKNIANEMCKLINKENRHNQIIEMHNRPYLVNFVKSKLNSDHVLTLFIHNDPLQMKGSKTVSERRNLVSKLDKIYCVSNYIKARFLNGIIDTNKKVVVLYNGVKRANNTLPKKRREVIFVGRIVHEKGVHLFVDSVKDIYKKYPNWSFKIIGSPKLGSLCQSNYSKSINTQFLNIGKNANIIGFINSDKLNKIMQRASIIVIPSIWQEPFGLVAAEAMSNGIAIIASNSGGLKEIVKKNGILIKDIDKYKISSSLELLMKDQKLLKDYQKKSWDHFCFNSIDISNNLDEHREKLFKN